jgi:hypothetical protein
MIGEMLRPFRLDQVRTTLRALIDRFHRTPSFNAYLPSRGKLRPGWAGIRPIFTVVRPIFTVVKSVLSAIRPSKQRAPINLISCASDLYNLGRVAGPFRCSSYFPIVPGILYKPLTPVQHRMIGILRCRWLPYPPFRKEHARDRVPLLA